jgi:hypothetical protein
MSNAGGASAAEVETPAAGHPAAAAPVPAAPPAVTRDEVDVLVRRAGLTLNAGQKADLAISYQHLVALAARIPRARPIWDEPCFTFAVAAPAPPPAPPPVSRVAKPSAKAAAKPASRPAAGAAKVATRTAKAAQPKPARTKAANKPARPPATPSGKAARPRR